MVRELGPQDTHDSEQKPINQGEFPIDQPGSEIIIFAKYFERRLDSQVAPVASLEPSAEIINIFSKMVEFGIDDEITRPVTDIEQAKRTIIDSAAQKVAQLDWSNFGIGGKTEEIIAFFDLAGLILRKSGIHFPLVLLRAGTFNEAKLLKTIPAEQKSHMADQYWLAMIRSPISVEDATLMRDWLYTKMPERLAKHFHLSPEAVIEHFINSDQSFRRATIRIQEHLIDRQT